MSILRLDIALEHLEAAGAELELPKDYPVPMRIKYLIRLASARSFEAREQVRAALKEMEECVDRKD